MRKFPLFAIALGLLACSGCVNYEQEVYLNPDYSGRIEIRFSVDPTVAMKAAAKEMTTAPEMQKTLSGIIEKGAVKTNVAITEEDFLKLFNPGSLKKKDFRKVDDRGVARFYFTAEFDDIRKLYAMEKKAILTEGDDGLVTYREYFEHFSDAKKKEMGEKGTDTLMRDFGFKYTLHMPQDIVTANTDRIEKNTAVWERPINAVTDNKDFYITATAKKDGI